MNVFASVSSAVINRLLQFVVYCIVFIQLVILVSGCSRETVSYDELETAGKVESYARKSYTKFFKAVKTLSELPETSGETALDSTFMKHIFSLTDQIIEHLRPFPTTFQSRIALDALSYAAHDIQVSPGFSRNEVAGFWKNALLDPILTKGREYYKSGNTNISTHLQLIRALQRGTGTQATDDMLLEIIPIVGPAPPKEIMEVCRKDSLIFKKIYDLIVYTRSLQEMGPPLWMITGPWFLAVDVQGWPLSFFCLRTLMIDDLLYLTFKEYNNGEVYAHVYDDPVPSDTSQMDAWLSRASEVMNSLEWNDALAEKVRTCDLSVNDTHNYYNDYMLIATADSVKKEFRIIFKREKVDESTFQFAGADSVEVLFTKSEIMAPHGAITPLLATRYQGDSLMGGQFIPGRKAEGKAYFIPMGVHDEKLLEEIQKSRMPEITVSTQ